MTDINSETIFPFFLLIAIDKTFLPKVIDETPEIWFEERNEAREGNWSNFQNGLADTIHVLDLTLNSIR
jgi:hypothetical protein